jgi:RimJ/RimL family protein N-acetyltransferase
MPVLAVLIAKARRAYQDGGVSLLAARAARAVAQATFRTSSADWYCRDLRLPISEVRPAVALKIEWDAAETLPWLRASRSFGPAEERELEVGLRAGHHYPGARAGEELIGCIKVGQGEVYVADFEQVIRFPEGTAFVYDTYVSPAWRGKRVAPFLITGVLRFLQDRGFRRVICHIPGWNRASIRAFQSCGFSRLRSIRFVKLLGLCWFSSRPETL